MQFVNIFPKSLGFLNDTHFSVNVRNDHIPTQLLVFEHDCCEMLLFYQNYLPFDYIYAFLSVFYHSAIIGTQNRHVPIVILIIKSIKTGHFRFFRRHF